MQRKVGFSAVFCVRQVSQSFLWNERVSSSGSEKSSVRGNSTRTTTGIPECLLSSLKEYSAFRGALCISHRACTSISTTAASNSPILFPRDDEEHLVSLSPDMKKEQSTTERDDDPLQRLLRSISDSLSRMQENSSRSTQDMILAGMKSFYEDVLQEFKGENNGSKEESVNLKEGKDQDAEKNEHDQRTERVKELLEVAGVVNVVIVHLAREIARTLRGLKRMKATDSISSDHMTREASIETLRELSVHLIELHCDAFSRPMTVLLPSSESNLRQSGACDSQPGSLEETCVSLSLAVSSLHLTEAALQCAVDQLYYCYDFNDHTSEALNCDSQETAEECVVALYQTWRSQLKSFKQLLACAREMFSARAGKADNEEEEDEKRSPTAAHGKLMLPSGVHAYLSRSLPFALSRSNIYHEVSRSLCESARVAFQKRAPTTDSARFRRYLNNVAKAVEVLLVDSAADGVKLRPASLLWAMELLRGARIVQTEDAARDLDPIPPEPQHAGEGNVNVLQILRTNSSVDAVMIDVLSVFILELSGGSTAQSHGERPRRKQPRVSIAVVQEAYVLLVVSRLGVIPQGTTASIGVPGSTGVDDTFFSFVAPHRVVFTQHGRGADDGSSQGTTISEAWMSWEGRQRMLLADDTPYVLPVSVSSSSSSLTVTERQRGTLRQIHGELQRVDGVSELVLQLVHGHSKNEALSGLSLAPAIFAAPYLPSGESATPFSRSVALWTVELLVHHFHRALTRLRAEASSAQLDPLDAAFVADLWRSSEASFERLLRAIMSILFITPRKQSMAGKINRAHADIGLESHARQQIYALLIKWAILQSGGTAAVHAAAVQTGSSRTESALAGAYPNAMGTREHTVASFLSVPLLTGERILTFLLQVYERFDWKAATISDYVDLLQLHGRYDVMCDALKATSSMWEAVGATDTEENAEGTSLRRTKREFAQASAMAVWLQLEKLLQVMEAHNHDDADPDDAEDAGASALEQQAERLQAQLEGHLDRVIQGERMPSPLRVESLKSIFEMACARKDARTAATALSCIVNSTALARELGKRVEQRLNENAATGAAEKEEDVDPVDEQNSNGRRNSHAQNKRADVEYLTCYVNDLQKWLGIDEERVDSVESTLGSNEKDEMMRRTSNGTRLHLHEDESEEETFHEMRALKGNAYRERNEEEKQEELSVLVEDLQLRCKSISIQAKFLASWCQMYGMSQLEDLQRIVDETTE